MPDLSAVDAGLGVEATEQRRNRPPSGVRKRPPLLNTGGRRGLSTISLDYIRNRCRIDDETGCWLWGLSVSSTGYPQINPVYGDAGNVRRITYRLARGPIRASYLITAEHLGDPCSKLCCCPDHLKQASRSRLQLLNYKRGLRDAVASVVTGRALAEASGLAKLSLQKAREIRASDKPVVQLAAEYGVSPATIYDVLRGRRWRENIRGASVFSQL